MANARVDNRWILDSTGTVEATSKLFITSVTASDAVVLTDKNDKQIVTLTGAGGVSYDTPLRAEGLKVASISATAIVVFQ